MVESPWGGTVTWTVRAAAAPAEGLEVPLVVAPGGPGLPHDYLQNLRGLARPGRPVVFYDPLGSGRSQLADGAEPQWTVGLLADELRRVIDAVAGAHGCFLLGHSSGGWVALDALVEDPALRAKVVKLVLASAPLDVPAYLASQAELIGSLRWRTRRRLRRPPPAGGHRLRTYQQAYQEYLERFACRPPWPPELAASSARSNRASYETLWGPSEVWATGPLATWSCERRVQRLTMPILLTSGRSDEVTPALMERARQLLPGAEWRVFEASAHMPHIEEAERYRDAVDTFLRP